MTLDVAELATSEDPGRVLDVEAALRALAEVDADAVDVVRLRIYTGMSVAEVADNTGRSLRTVARDWSFARAWLYDRLRDGGA